MSENHIIDWDAVTSIAQKLGVTSEAVRKWRERGSVPGKWHAPIIAASKGRVPVKAFLPSVSTHPKKDAA